MNYDPNRSSKSSLKNAAKNIVAKTIVDSLMQRKANFEYLPVNSIATVLDEFLVKQAIFSSSLNSDIVASDIESLALDALSIFLTTYGASYVMNSQVGLQNIAKRAALYAIAEYASDYAYNEYKKNK